MRLALNPSPALKTVKQTGQRRAFMAEAVMQVVDGAGRMMRQIGQDMRLGLREVPLAKGAINPQRNRVCGALQRWDKPGN